MRTIIMDTEKIGEMSEFDNLIDRWNRMTERRRSAKRRECAQHGHQWARAVSEGKMRYRICTNCTSYDNNFRSQHDRR